MARHSGPPRLPEPNPASPEVLRQSLKDYAVITLDREGRIVQWSFRRGENLRLYGSGNHRPGFCRAVYARRPGSPPPGAGTAQRHPEESAVDERWHVRKDGGRIWLSGTVCAVQNAGGMTGYSKVARDITSQKLAELQKETLLERERAAREQAEREWKRLGGNCRRDSRLHRPGAPAGTGLRVRQSQVARGAAGRGSGGRTVREAPEPVQVAKLFNRVVETGTAQTIPDCPVLFGAGSNEEVRYFDITHQPMRRGVFPYDSVLTFAVEVTERVRARQLAAGTRRSWKNRPACSTWRTMPSWP